MKDRVSNILPRLSAVDRNVLALVELSCGTVTEIAQRLKLRPHVVQYAFKKLRRYGLLDDRRVWIDVHRLGYSFVTLYLRPRYDSAASKRSFMSAITHHPTCTWIFETCGQYHLACSLTIKDMNEVSSFYDLLNTVSGVRIDSKALTIQRDFAYFGRKYLWGSKPAYQPVNMPISPSLVTLDEEDLKLVQELARGRVENEAMLYKVTGIPSATVYRRLASLRKRGVLGADYYWLNSASFGRQLYVLRISFSGMTGQIKDKIWQLARLNASVVYAIETLGSWDYELGVDLESAAELSALIEDITAAMPSLSIDVDPIPVTRFIKVRSFPV
jgi:DNA-binding Lrp family transcriptional regulator